MLKKNEPIFTITYPKLYDLSNISEVTSADIEDLKKSKTQISFKKEGGVKSSDLLESVNNFKKNKVKKMTDKLAKYLNKISVSDYKKIKEIIGLISKLDFVNLDIKKMKAFDNKYSIRSGKHRIIFRIQNGISIIEEIKKRDENTY